MNGKTCLNFKLCQSNLSLYLSSLYKLFIFICLEFKKRQIMLENTSYILTSVLLLWGGRMVSHATRTEMCGISLVFLTAFTEEEPPLPGPRLAAPSRMLCGPGLSTKLRGLPAKQGSQTWGGSFPFSEEYL